MPASTLTQRCGALQAVTHLPSADDKKPTSSFTSLSGA